MGVLAMLLVPLDAPGTVGCLVATAQVSRCWCWWCCCSAWGAANAYLCLVRCWPDAIRCRPERPPGCSRHGGDDQKLGQCPLVFLLRQPAEWAVMWPGSPR